MILALVQMGGLGFMVLASLLALALSRRIGLRQRLLTTTEINVAELGETRRVLLGVAGFSVAFEVLAAAVLTGRFWLGYGEPLGRAAWLGLFHSVSGLQQRRVRPVQRQPGRLRGRRLGLPDRHLAVIAGGLGFQC